MELQQLTEKVIQLEASKEYFVTSIAMQTGIFVFVVGLFSVISFIQTRREIRAEARRYVKQLREELLIRNKEQLTEIETKLNNKVAKISEKINSEILNIKADVGRNFGLFFEETKEYLNAFLYTMRSISFYSKLDEEFTKTGLVIAKGLLDKIQEDSRLHEMSHESLNAYEQYLKLLDAQEFNELKNEIDDKFKELTRVGKIKIIKY